MKNPHTPNLTWIGSWWPKIWPHAYLISPTEISVNWPVRNCLKPGQLTLISVGLIRYSCGHISGPCRTDSHQIWAVDVFHHAPPIHGIQNAEMQKKFFCDVIASVLYTSLWPCIWGHFIDIHGRSQTSYTAPV